MNIQHNNRTKCYTFYSYKGGSGRSTTAVNTVNHLIDKLSAGPDNPILLIDADLESAGLTFFFGLENKFNSRFPSGLHATMFLDGMRDPADCFDKSTLRQTMPKKISDAFDEKISKEVPFVKEIFENVALTKQDWDMLRIIIQKYNEYMTEYRDNDISAHYDIMSLLTDLRNIHNDSTFASDEKIRRKTEIVDDFLPASVFVDVSHFFDQPKGTVRFLGVDINYEGDRMTNESTTDEVIGNAIGNTIGNSSVVQIRKLVRLCSDEKKGHKCAAIVFDSGAGTQSSAHLFHQCSDVLIYCMRPSMQFARGTYTNIDKYRETLRIAQEENGKTEGQKSIILLPTAVPLNDEFAPLRQSCFKKICEIVEDFPDLVDGSFCAPGDALCEVSLFKWREQILGVKGNSIESTEQVQEVCDIVRRYTDPKNFEPGSDVECAYNTYQKLAEQIIKNS